MALDMLREIQAFVSVAHKRSFVAAARALGRSPSAVTRAVQTLEDNAGSKLLNRNANAVTLTEAGERLLPHAERLLDVQRDAADELAALSGSAQGWIRFAAPQLLGELRGFENVEFLRWLKADHFVFLGARDYDYPRDASGAYQAEAIAPTLTDRLPPVGQEALTQLVKGDLYISFNAHQGRPEVLTDWMDASVIDENDPTLTDPALDPFNPDNGPPYSDEFIAKYRAGQRARNQRITDWAKAELERLNAAGIPDRIFPMFRCWGDIRCVDPAIDPSDRKPNWCYRGDPALANRTPSIGRANTLKTWLNMWSLETSPCQGQPHLAKHDTPALVVQGTADTGVFPSDARKIFAR